MVEVVLDDAIADSCWISHVCPYNGVMALVSTAAQLKHRWDIWPMYHQCSRCYGTTINHAVAVVQLCSILNRLRLGCLELPRAAYELPRAAYELPRAAYACLRLVIRYKYPLATQVVS